MVAKIQANRKSRKDGMMTSLNFNLKTIGTGIAGAAAISAYLFKFRPWHLRWGATDEEIGRDLPGDELVPSPKQTSTRAVTIQAPIAEVWPWLAQLGQGRGGFYSYDWLENLIGCDIHNADRIIPEYQDLKLGDKVRLGPEGYPFYSVAAVEPGRVLVLRAGDPTGASAPIDETWAFLLEPIGETATRLIVRDRRDYEPTPGNFVMWQVITEPAHFVMERKMLLGLKARAEAGEVRFVPAGSYDGY
jgi:hypothetical protein